LTLARRSSGALSDVTVPSGGMGSPVGVEGQNQAQGRAPHQISFRPASTSALRGSDSLDHTTFRQNAKLRFGTVSNFSQRISALCPPISGARRGIRHGEPLRMAASPGYTKLRPSSGCPTSFQKPRSCRWRSSRSAPVGSIYPSVYAEFGGTRYIRLGALDGAISTEQFHARIRPDNAMGLSRKQWLWSPNRAGVGLTSGDAAA